MIAFKSVIDRYFDHSRSSSLRWTMPESQWPGDLGQWAKVLIASFVALIPLPSCEFPILRQVRISSRSEVGQLIHPVPRHPLNMTSHNSRGHLS